MGLFTLEHGKAAYFADMAVYGIAVVTLAGLLFIAGPPNQTPTNLGLVLSGLAGWTAIEYVLHRFVLHGLAPFRGWHEEHHRRPTALISTPTLLSGGLIAGLVFLPALLWAGAWHACGLTLGVLAGYLAYTLTHHATHHWRAGNSAWLRERKHWHALHHQRGAPPACFGVTSTFWDRVCHTARPGGTAPH